VYRSEGQEGRVHIPERGASNKKRYKNLCCVYNGVDEYYCTPLLGITDTGAAEKGSDQSDYWVRLPHWFPWIHPKSKFRREIRLMLDGRGGDIG
jgi:hypothetical protein